jgi:hypothetical protein
MVDIRLMKSNDYSIEDCTATKKKVDSLQDIARANKRNLIVINNYEPPNKRNEKKF